MRTVKLTDRDRLDLAGHKQNMARMLERDGFEPRSSELLALHGDGRHWTLWTYDALWDACAMLLNGEDAAYALRTLLKAREYQGRLGGYWPGSWASDAAACIERILTDALRGELVLVEPPRHSPPCHCDRLEELEKYCPMHAPPADTDTRKEA